ncbi:MAG: PAS domain S-box protein, partial [Dehalococcoidia bacterium]|nr:PAS domain S-box protein [Dehalococcoidia bacterium]
MQAKPDYEQIVRKLAELEEIIGALRIRDIAARDGVESVSSLRLKETEVWLREQRDYLEQLSKRNAELQVELEARADELRSSRQAAQDSRDKYLDLYDNAPVGYLTLKRDGSILDANQTAARMLGLEKEALIRSPLTRFIGPDSQDEFHSHMNRVCPTSGHEKSEIRMRRRDGSEFYALLDSVAIEGPGQCRTTLSDITQRKRVEQELQRSEGYLKALMEHSLDAVTIIGDDGTIRYESPSYERLLGFKPEERVKTSIFERLHPDDAEGVAKLFSEFLPNRGGTIRAEVRARHKDGSWRFIEAVGTNLLDNPIVNGIVLNLRDVSERRRVEEALRDSEERYRALFDRSLHCVYVHDLEGNFLDANETALELLGYEREDLPNLSFASLLSQDQLPKASATLQELKEGEAQQQVSEYRLRCKDGSFVVVETVAAVIYREGRPYAIQGVGRNITERRKMEEELRRYREHLEDLVERRTLELRQLAHRLVEAQEQERARLAHELHDEIGQQLTYTALLIDRAMRNQGSQVLAEAKSMIQEAISGIRSLSVIPLLMMLRSTGLVRSLFSLTQEHTRRSSTPVEFKHENGLDEGVP